MMAFFTSSLLLVYLFSLGVFSVEACVNNETCTFNYTEKGTLCSKLWGNMIIEGKLNITQKTNETLCVPCHHTTINRLEINGSCNETIGKNKLKNTLNITWHDDGDVYHLNFSFTQSTKAGHKQWLLDVITFSMFEDDDDDTQVNFNASGDFIPDQDYTRSFNCKSNESVTLEPVDKKIYPANITLYISNFTVQAFHFNKNGTFGRPYQCSADSSGNKIVPIAVGAALAGLIVIVLIAFVAGRLINRKKNTYEPLS